MNKLYCFALATIVAVLPAPASIAAESTSALVGIPGPPDMSSMKWIVGTWSCSRASSRRAAPIPMTQTYSIEPGSFWIKGITTNKPTSYFPHAGRQEEKITYDAGNSRWVDATTNDVGGYNFSVSSGWTGNSLHWKQLAYSRLGDEASEGDIVLTKLGNDRMTYGNSFTTVGGKRVESTISCTRVP